MSPLILSLIGINIIISYRGLNDPYYKNKYLFYVRGILEHREFYRIITSGFLHANWIHLGFNMYALYAFTKYMPFDQLQFLLLYFGSLIFGNLLALLFNQYQSHYSALGASGAVSGVVFANIAVAPNESIGFITLPGIELPAWIFGILYLLFTMFGIKRKMDNIGHEAHLGGAIMRILICLAFTLNYTTKINLPYWLC